MRLRVVDIETSGGKPSEIIEIAAVDVFQEAGEWRASQPRSRLFRPHGPITVHATAIHHLKSGDFPAFMPVCDTPELKAFLFEGHQPDVLVAHNATFESAHIKGDITGDLRWICTVKGAKSAWPEAPGYSNQVLRYWRDLDLDPALAMPPHRAGPDAWVTAHILLDLLETLSVEDLLEATHQPRKLDTIPFGRYRGKAWSDVPHDYLAWMALQSQMDADVVARARVEMLTRQSQSIENEQA